MVKSKYNNTNFKSFAKAGADPSILVFYMPKLSYIVSEI